MAAKSFLPRDRRLPPSKASNPSQRLASPWLLQKPLTSNLRRASIHAPLGGRKVFSYGFETAACPPRKLQILRGASRLPWLLQKPLTSNLRRASIHAPLGGRKVFSYGFETAACPPRKLQILRSASSLPPLQNLRSASSPSTAPTQKPSNHEPLGGRKVFSYGFETAACPPRKLQILRSASRRPGSCKSL